MPFDPDVDPIDKVFNETTKLVDFAIPVKIPYTQALIDDIGYCIMKKSHRCGQAITE